MARAVSTIFLQHPFLLSHSPPLADARGSAGGLRQNVRMKFLRLVSLSALAIALNAQSKERIATGFDDIQAAKLRADLTFLASDSMEGRMSLERGSEVA